jgi:hypothetical protein
MLVPLDFRLMTLPLEGGSGFEVFCSGSNDDNDEAVDGGEAGGCTCDCEADIAAPFVGSSWMLRRLTRRASLLVEIECSGRAGRALK